MITGRDARSTAATRDVCPANSLQWGRTQLSAEIRYVQSHGLARELPASKGRPCLSSIQLRLSAHSQGAAQQTAGQCAGMLVVAQDDLAIDYGGH